MCTVSRVDNFAVDSSVLLNVRHLPDTGYCIQCVSHIVTSPVAAVSTVYASVKYPQVIVLKYIKQ